MDVLSGKQVKKDYQEAFRWFLEVAEQGHVIAVYMVGDFYNRGIGVNENEPEAVKWLTKAAENGELFAELDLFLSYRYGKSIIKQDFIEASFWALIVSNDDLQDLELFLAKSDREQTLIRARKWYQSNRNVLEMSLFLSVGFHVRCDYRKRIFRIADGFDPERYSTI